MGTPFGIYHCNAAGGLDIHSVNATSAASYAQNELKEAATAAQSAVVKGRPLGSPWRLSPRLWDFVPAPLMNEWISSEPLESIEAKG